MKEDMIQLEIKTIDGQNIMTCTQTQEDVYEVEFTETGDVINLECLQDMVDVLQTFINSINDGNLVDGCLQ